MEWGHRLVVAWVGVMACGVATARAQAPFREIVAQASAGTSGIGLHEELDGGLLVGGVGAGYLVHVAPDGGITSSEVGPNFATFEVTSDGGRILAGNASPQYASGFVLKTDASGAQEWGSGFALARGGVSLDAIHQLPDGGYVATGDTTIRFDATGALSWGVRHAGGGNGHAVRETSDGGCVVAGAGFDGAPSPYLNAFVSRLTPAGTVAWTRVFGFASADEARAVTELADGTFVVAGVTSLDNLSRDAFVAQLDAGGAILWARSYASPGDDSFETILEASDGSFVVAGTLEGHAAIAKLDRAGVVQWARRHSDITTGAESAILALAESPVGGFVGVGRVDGDMLVVRTDVDGRVPSCSLSRPSIVEAPCAFPQLATSAATTPALVRYVFSYRPGWNWWSPRVTPCNPAGNWAPACDSGSARQIGCFQVALDSATASDADRDPLTYSWSGCGERFSDPTSLNPVLDLDPYCNPGCTAWLSVYDGRGGSCHSSVDVSVVIPPPTITCPSDVSLGCPGPVPPPDTSAPIVAGCVQPNVRHVGDVPVGTGCAGIIRRTYEVSDCWLTATCTQVFRFATVIEARCDDGLDDDADGFVDCDDPDCLADPAGDCDSDGVTNDVDCAPADQETWSVAQLVHLLFVRRFGTATEISWSDVFPGGSATVHDVVTGGVAALRSERGFASASCLVRDVPIAYDARPNPAPLPDGYWYLVRGRSACGTDGYGEGTFGSNLDPALCN